MKRSIFIFIAILLTACGNTRTYTEQEQRSFQDVKDMVSAQNLEITSSFARPTTSAAFNELANSGVLGVGNTANNIDISGNSNNLTIKGDSISGFFPFFGELQFGGGTIGSNHQGIEFKDKPEDYRVTVNDIKHRIEITFSIDDQYRNTERYNVRITLFQNKSSDIQINSTNRSSIEYSGIAKPLQQDMIVKK